MEILREMLSVLGAFIKGRGRSVHTEECLVGQQSFDDIVNRIDKEIESIDQQLINLKTTVEQDLINLYYTYKGKFEELGYQTQDNFNANFQNRLIESTHISLNRAKEDLEQLKIEILRVCVSSV